MPADRSAGGPSIAAHLHQPSRWDTWDLRDAVAAILLTAVSLDAVASVAAAINYAVQDNGSTNPVLLALYFSGDQLGRGTFLIPVVILGLVWWRYTTFQDVRDDERTQVALRTRHLLQWLAVLFGFTAVASLAYIVGLLWLHPLGAWTDATIALTGVSFFLVSACGGYASWRLKSEVTDWDDEAVATQPPVTKDAFGSRRSG